MVDKLIAKDEGLQTWEGLCTWMRKMKIVVQ